ncbi:unnamed protein product, partial [Heterosigma akashiwo]
EAVVQVLLAAGADKEVRQFEQCTPLQLASKQGHGAVVQMLLTAGADKDAMDNQNNTAHLLATSNGHCKAAAIMKKASKANECLICKMNTTLRCQLCRKAAF